ncbi:hypothetical protein evm_015585 [Chilo suppressalis]|nr:hypothetical protein evm_015585 [Chilo suppressalis]
MKMSYTIPSGFPSPESKLVVREVITSKRIIMDFPIARKSNGRRNNSEIYSTWPPTSRTYCCGPAII